VSAYLRLLAVPRFGPLIAASIVARLPIGVNGLAVVLFLNEQTGSFAVAGAVAGSLALGVGLGAPFMGRLVDRTGTGVLLPLALGHACGLLALLGLGSADAPPALLVAAGALTGASIPPTSSVLRARYPVLLRGREPLVTTAFALDSVLTELIFVAGPLLTALLVVLVDPGAALVLSAACVVAGTAAFLAAGPPPLAPGRARSGGTLGALHSPGIRTLVVSMLPVGFGFGAMEVALPAFADAEGRPELAGVLIAVWSIASAAGGLAYGARPSGLPLARVHVLAAMLVPLGFLVTAAASSLAVMLLLVLPAGVAIAPLIASRNELAGAAAPEGAETEALTWPLTALVGGIALGAAAGGTLADGPGWRAAVLVAAAAAAAGALVSFTRRATLAPA